MQNSFSQLSLDKLRLKQFNKIASRYPEYNKTKLLTPNVCCVRVCVCVYVCLSVCVCYCSCVEEAALYMCVFVFV